MYVGLGWRINHGRLIDWQLLLFPGDKVTNKSAQLYHVSSRAQISTCGDAIHIEEFKEAVKCRKQTSYRLQPGR